MADPQAPPAESQATPAADLVAEADDWEAESALGESLASSTTSINSSILKYREENGRTYHAYKVDPSPKACSVKLTRKGWELCIPKR
jgi:hypothetical protein